MGLNKKTNKLIAWLLVVTNGAIQAMPTVNFVSGCATPCSHDTAHQPALAASAVPTILNGLDAWNKFDNRSIKPDYSSYPNFAIIPR